jgi:hypothetical protein
MAYAQRAVAACSVRPFTMLLLFFMLGALLMGQPGERVAITQMYLVIAFGFGILMAFAAAQHHVPSSRESCWSRTFSVRLPMARSTSDRSRKGHPDRHPHVGADVRRFRCSGHHVCVRIVASNKTDVPKVDGEFSAQGSEEAIP